MMDCEIKSISDSTCVSTTIDGYNHFLSGQSQHHATMTGHKNNVLQQQHGCDNGRMIKLVISGVLAYREIIHF